MTGCSRYRKRRSRDMAHNPAGDERSCLALADATALCYESVKITRWVSHVHEVASDGAPATPGTTRCLPAVSLCTHARRPADTSSCSWSGSADERAAPTWGYVLHERVESAGPHYSLLDELAPVIFVATGGAPHEPQASMKAERSALNCSRCATTRPWGAPGWTFNVAFSISSTERNALAQAPASSSQP